MMTNTMSRFLFVGLVIAASASLLEISCSSSSGPAVGSTSSSSSGNGGSSVTISTSTAGSSGSSSSSGGAGGSSTYSTDTSGTCGTTTAGTNAEQADVLIVFDNTDSMDWSLTADSSCSTGATNCSSRLSVVAPGVTTVVNNNSKINWGLQFLLNASSSGTCAVYSSPQVAIGSSSAAASITAALTSVQLGLSTPTAAALTSATAYLKTVSDSNNKVILLATDGEPNCPSGSNSQTWSNDDLSGATAAAKAAYAAGFQVYVIGIGPSTTNLDALAVAGGTSKYYPATSASALTSALSSIAKAVSTTCTFKSSNPPPSKDLVFVYVDKTLVAQSDSNGWKFDTSDSTYSTITLTGTYCDDMLAGKTSQVQIVFGCPGQDAATIIL